MKRILMIGSLSLVAAAFVSQSASAQDTTSRAGTVARTPSYMSLLSAIKATPEATTRVKERSVTAQDIRIVDVKTVVGGEDDAVLKSALSSEKTNVNALRTAIGNNPAYQAALAAHKDKPTAKDIVAVDILNDGDVLVYFWKM